MVWGILAGFLNIVPYFGPLIVTAGLAIVGFLQFGTLHMAAIGRRRRACHHDD